MAENLTFDVALDNAQLTVNDQSGASVVSLTFAVTIGNGSMELAEASAASSETFLVAFDKVVKGDPGTTDFDELTNRPSYNGAAMTHSTDIPAVPTKTSQLQNDSGFLTEHQSLAAYSTTQQMNAAIAVHHDSTKQDKIDSAHKLSYTLLSDTPAIPTKTSELTNDSGFLTEHQSLAAYRTASDQDVIDATKADKSDTYTKTETDSAIAAHHDSTKYDASNPSGYQNASQVSTAISAHHDSTKQNTIDSSHKLSADFVDDASTTNKFVTSAEKATWNGKQDALVFAAAADVTAYCETLFA